MIFGEAVADFGGDEFVKSVLVLPDGKLLVVGGTVAHSPGGSLGSVDIALARFNADGTLDTSFNQDGLLSLLLPGDESTSNVLQGPDGTLLVGATINNSLVLARLSADGEVLAVYPVPTPGSAANYVNSLALQPDGKVLMTARNGADFVLARIGSDGVMDASFGTGGVVTTDFGAMDHPRTMVLQADGKILVAGSTANTLSGSQYAVARYNQDGTLDTGFSDDGQLTMNVGGGLDAVRSMSVQPDGKIVLAGMGNNHMTIARLNADGSLDTGFAQGGTTQVGFGYASYANSVVIQPDGKILVAGWADDGAGLVRLNADGSRDTGFADNGVTVTFFPEEAHDANAIVLQPDGSILVAGSGNNFSMVRFSSQGVLDTAFGATLGVTLHRGDDSNDVFIATVPSEFFDGGSGRDTVVFSGPMSQYTLERSGDLGYAPFLTVTEHATAGSDYLSGIERVEFGDWGIAWDLNFGNADYVARILSAVFGVEAVANPYYVGIGLHYLDGGMDYQGLGALALAAAGMSAPAEVVELLWHNVMGSPIPDADKAHYVGLLEGGLEIGVLATWAADTNNNRAHVFELNLELTGLPYIDPLA